jgi:hypothetical protein
MSKQQQQLGQYKVMSPDYFNYDHPEQVRVNYA